MTATQFAAQLVFFAAQLTFIVLHNSPFLATPCQNSCIHVQGPCLHVQYTGISKRGATTLTVFGDIMESTFFTEDLLSKCLMSFICEMFPDGHSFQQDNGPKHTSKLTQKFVENNNISWWKTAMESPHTNPIELMWHEIKHLRKHVKPKTKEELMAGLEWVERMTPDKCAKYIRKVIYSSIYEKSNSQGHREGRQSKWLLSADVPDIYNNSKHLVYICTCRSHQINKRYDQFHFEFH